MRFFTRLIAAASFACVALGAAASPADPVEGVDYLKLPQIQPTESGKKVEVLEFFWYGCPHCFKLEPHMQTWLRNIPKDVNFIRTPASMNPLWEQGARGYYVSEALGIRKKTHLPLFHAIHDGGQQIFDQKSQAKFFVKYGVPEAKFNSMFNSFAITSKVAQANKLAQQYQLTGVPAIVVNGKYVVQGEDGKVTQVVSYLVEKERKAK